MSRHHCRSARHESRPSNFALSNNERQRGCQKRSHTNIYSLAHAIGMLPRTYHHCHSTRRGMRPSNYALSNDEWPAAASTFPMTLVHPPIYMSGKLSNHCALSNNERHPTPRTLPPVDIYSLVPAYCRIASNLELFSGTHYSLPPPRKEHRRGSPSVHPKRWPVHPRRRPVHPNLSPAMFEGLRGEFRWHLRSRHRGPKGWSGDTSLRVFCDG